MSGYVQKNNLYRWEGLAFFLGILGELISLSWSSYRSSDAYSDTLLGYANSIRTVDGGTHIDGVKASLTRTLNNLAKKSKVIKVFYISSGIFQYLILFNSYIFAEDLILIYRKKILL